MLCVRRALRDPLRLLFVLCCFFSMRVATAEQDLPGSVCTSHRATGLGGTKMPPTISFRGDTGTAQDILAAIDHHQAPAAPHQAHPGDAGILNPDGEVQVHRELDALLAFPGQQQFAFYRADPGGTTEFHLTVTQATTFEDIRHRLLQTWPDLGQMVWHLVPLDPSWNGSPFSVPGAVSVLVWSFDDLFAGRVSHYCHG